MAFVARAANIIAGLRLNTCFGLDFANPLACNAVMRTRQHTALVVRSASESSFVRATANIRHNYALSQPCSFSWSWQPGYSKVGNLTLFALICGDSAEFVVSVQSGDGR